MNGADLAVVCDLDGTLLTSAKTLSPRTRSALVRARADGVPLAVASARPLRMIEAVLGNDLELLDAIIVSNGAAVVARDVDGVAATDHLAALEPDVVVELVHRVRTVWPDAGLGWETGARFAFDAAFADLTARQMIVRDAQGPAADTLPTAPVHQLVVAVPGCDPRECLALAAEAVGGSATVTDSRGGVVELSAPHADKATAARRWAASRGLAPSALVAFGDEHNELPLLLTAGLGVAMANARPEIREQADEVTATNDDDGVAVILDQLAAAGWRR